MGNADTNSHLAVNTTSDMLDKATSEVINFDKIEQAVRMILEAVGEDPNREGLLDTPMRVAKMYQELFSGLHRNIGDELSARFHVEHDDLVLVREIPFYSMCEHHLIPFFGQAHIAYLPTDHVVTGLSKLARLVDTVARRPQVQERMTNQIADALTNELGASGVLVMLEAEHLCMSMRGIKKPGSQTVTLAVRGRYEQDNSMREQILHLIQKN